MSKEISLIISATSDEKLKEFHLENKDKRTLSMILRLGNILSIQHFSEDVLVINFEFGELRLDVTSDQLKKIKYEEI
jgi:hypothetical protein